MTECEKGATSVINPLEVAEGGERGFAKEFMISQNQERITWI